VVFGRVYGKGYTSTVLREWRRPKTRGTPTGGNCVEGVGAFTETHEPKKKLQCADHVEGKSGQGNREHSEIGPPKGGKF